MFVRVRDTMPIDGPGRLSAQQTVDVVAFILLENKINVGDQPLAAGADALKTIAINAVPPPVAHQSSEKNSEWRYWGGDGATTHYSPLAQIDRTNVKTLRLVWRWKSENFGPRPDDNWKVTPLMVGGVLYFTAGAARDVVAADAVTGQTLWTFHKDEGSRGRRAPNRGPGGRGLSVLVRRPG